MKTFTQIQKFPKGTCGEKKDMRRITVVSEDPKRNGFYKMDEYQAGNGKVNKFCLFYGKKNQPKIIEATKNMIEVI